MWAGFAAVIAGNCPVLLKALVANESLRMFSSFGIFSSVGGRGIFSGLGGGAERLIMGGSSTAEMDCDNT